MSATLQHVGRIRAGVYTPTREEATMTNPTPWAMPRPRQAGKTTEHRARADVIDQLLPAAGLTGAVSVPIADLVRVLRMAEPAQAEALAIRDDVDSGANASSMAHADAAAFDRVLDAALDARLAL